MKNIYLGLVLIVALMLGACGGGNDKSGTSASSPSVGLIGVTLDGDVQKIEIQLDSAGMIGADTVAEGPIDPSTVKHLHYRSDRNGWHGDFSTSSAPEIRAGKLLATIANVPLADFGFWEIEIKGTNLEIPLFNEQIICLPRVCSMVTDKINPYFGLVQYGDYQPATISYAQGALNIKLASNVVHGFVGQVRAWDVDRLEFRSDGWPQVVLSGRLIAEGFTITGFLPADFVKNELAGTISLFRKNGTEIWLDLATLKKQWQVSGLKLNVADGKIILQQ